MQNFRSKMTGIKNKIENSTYETLNNVAKTSEGITTALWTSSMFLSTISNSFSDLAFAGGMNLVNIADIEIGSYLKDNKKEMVPAYLSHKMPSSIALVALGSASLLRTIEDAYSGRLERIPHDVTFTAASYANAVSNTIRYHAERKKLKS
jgi:hypothetical protein